MVLRYRVKDGKWIWTEFKDLKKGDTFRMTEPDGTIVKDESCGTEWTCASDAYLNEDGNYQVDTIVENDA